MTHRSTLYTDVQVLTNHVHIKCPGIQVYRYTSVQIYRYTGVQVYRYTGVLYGTVYLCVVNVPVRVLGVGQVWWIPIVGCVGLYVDDI